MSKKAINVYLRENCDLCESLARLLQAHWPPIFEEINWVDIDTDIHAFRKYGKFIPVVELNGESVLQGKIDPISIQKYFGPPVNPLY